MNEILNSISNKDPLVGQMSYQMFECAKSDNWYCALMSLFVLVEQVLRWSTNSDTKNRFTDITQQARDHNLLEGNDIETIERIRYFRNKYIHSNFHSNGFDIDGIFYPVSEMETAEEIFGMISTPSLLLINKLLDQSYD